MRSISYDATKNDDQRNYILGKRNGLKEVQGGLAGQLTPGVSSQHNEASSEADHSAHLEDLLVITSISGHITNPTRDKIANLDQKVHSESSGASDGRLDTQLDTIHGLEHPTSKNYEVSISPKEPSLPAYVASSSKVCTHCNEILPGQFVRALGRAYHLNCFKCADCGTPIATKFFAAAGPEGTQITLCERDYFRRLDLICERCNMALRGNYITSSANKKYHDEHFTCALCSTHFGAEDSYYEHDGEAYCYIHYSTRFALRCAGCIDPILKQYVETNRNGRDERWHSECYMINKFWNVKISPRRLNNDYAPLLAELEEEETLISLKSKRMQHEQKIHRIWNVLSAFEESSAACISDMLRYVSNAGYLDAIRASEKFILHVEVLFATICDLSSLYELLDVKCPTHVREARLLCRKTVDLFTLLSRPATAATANGMTQDLLALVTGIAHYLKILIRIALTAALKLECEHDLPKAIESFLNKLSLLGLQGGDPVSLRILSKEESAEILSGSATDKSSTHSVSYGFRSLAPEIAGQSPFHQKDSTNITAKLKLHPPTDLCVHCKLTVEDICVRLGTYQRWHPHCLQCAHCGKAAGLPPLAKEKPPEGRELEEKGGTNRGKSREKSTPPNVAGFVYNPKSIMNSAEFGDVPVKILCTEHAPRGCRGGFQSVERLEQYAYLLNVALRRLYLLLDKRGVIISVSTITTAVPLAASTIQRTRSGILDRELPRIPGSTVIERPPGQIKPPEPQSVDSPQTLIIPAPQVERSQSGPSQRPPYSDLDSNHPLQPPMHVRSFSEKLLRDPELLLEDDSDGESLVNLRPSLREFFFVSRLIDPISDSTRRLRNLMR